MNQPYTPAAFLAPAFHCPNCGTYAKQIWSSIYAQGVGQHLPAETMALSYCSHCDGYMIWHNKLPLYPGSGGAQHPNPDMPRDIQIDYNEARGILTSSPRGAAALLRLALQKLCIHLGESGKDINRDIGELVKKGLSPRIQKALDFVRVIGNEAVHPGQIDLKDDVETATQLFLLLNLIVDDRISKDKEIDALYEKLPQSKREGIDARDKK